jgi:hypothetical protein
MSEPFGFDNADDDVIELVRNGGAGNDEETGDVSTSMEYESTISPVAYSLLLDKSPTRNFFPYESSAISPA